MGEERTPGGAERAGPACGGAAVPELDRSRVLRHAPAHVVIGCRGGGRVRLGDKVHAVGYGDVAYVASDAPHRYPSPHRESFLLPVHRGP
ncbi:MAG TPA: hypothetical protein VF158_16095 [Longimicrobiales bacterium]